MGRRPLLRTVRVKFLTPASATTRGQAVLVKLRVPVADSVRLAVATRHQALRSTGNLPPNNSFKPSPPRYGIERTVDRAGRLNSGVRCQ